MPMARTPWLAFLAAALSAASALARPAKHKGLVPANFNQRTDALGFMWDVQANGAVDDGSDDCFDTGMALLVNGSGFSPSARPVMTADGREYVLSGQVAGLKITRRVLVDTKRAAARYLEVCHNPGTKTVQAQVSLVSNLGANAQATLSSSGKPFVGGGLGKKDAGFVTLSTSSRPCVLFLLASHRSKLKPTVQVQNNRTYRVDYRITVRPKATVTLFHLVAQRRGLSASNAADAFKPFYRSRLIKPELPRELRRTVANFRAGLGGDLFAAGELIQAVADLAEAHGVDRGADDVLVVDEEAHLAGTASVAGLEAETRHGKAQVTLAEVALLYGGAGVGRPMRLHLRNGEVLAGPIRATGLRLTTRGGMSLALDPKRINLLVARAAKSDGQPADGAIAYVRTHQGDRLAVGSAQPMTIEAATAWGPLTLPLERVERLVYAREPQPGLRLVLADRSQFPVVLRGDELAVHTLRFGTVKLPPQDVAALIRIVTKPAHKDGNDDPGDDLPDDEIHAPHCMLAGDHVLVGPLAAPAVHVVTATGVTPVDTARIHKMERSEDDNPALPAFELELQDGGTLAGPLEERLLPVRVGQCTLRVPVEHIFSYTVPKPKPTPKEEEPKPKEKQKPKDPAAELAPVEEEESEEW